MKMKKRNILLAFLITAAGITSCDMEKYPYSAVEESQYMTTMTDFSNARVGLYSYYRSITTGGYILTQEIQGDDFQASANFSNTYGNQYRWDFQTTDGNIASIWSAYYSLIARCNYFLDAYEKVQNGEIESLSESDIKLIACYAGEAYFTRAYSYYQLATLFCKAYDTSSAENEYGLPLQLTYNSSATDASKYPGRSSLKATFEQITSDLNNANSLVDETSTVASDQDPVNYITKDVVTAMRARVALWMKDYDTAISTSTSLITGGKYPLISDAETFRNMWVMDMGSEVIWQIFMEAPNELGNTMGTLFWGQYRNGEAQTMDFLPSQNLIDLYDQNDIRLSAFFAPYHLVLSTGAEGDVYIFDKYPGNPDIYNNTNVDNHYINKSKPFRIAEQYLIAAEAYLGKNDVTNASIYLNDLRRARIANYSDQTYTAISAELAVQDERHKELVGEGFRLIDLKRWGLGLNRANAYQQSDMVLQPGGTNTTALSKSADDFRFVWPIPKDEYDANPQIHGQQNEGY